MNQPCTTLSQHNGHPHATVEDPLNLCPGVTAEQTGEFDVAAWWTKTNAEDHRAFVPKFDEYGSEDLLAIGRNLADILGREVTDDEANELGIYFYLYGKMARWTEAVKGGRPVSDDTLHDLTVYSMMARLNRAGGMG